MDGIDSTRAIRALSIPATLQPWIVALTAVGDAKERCIASGMNAFMCKPVSLQRISDAIKQGALHRTGTNGK